MNINDRKILYAIDSFLPKDKFVIFPYGRWGKRAQYLLNKKYGINEVAIVDNKLSEKDKGIISINDLSQIEGDYVVLFATENISVRKELSTAFMNFQGHPVCDIASLEIRNDIYFSMQCDRLYIEDCDEKQKDAVFAMTKQTWTQLGKTQPYWSVLTDKKYLIENMDDKRLQEFYNSGAGSCNMIVQTLIRNQVIQDKSEAKNLDITEIGCGTGRVTKHLANTFRSVNAVDISAGNVEIAKRMVSAGNVLFHVYEDIYEYSNLPKTDIIYSIMVLQHNVPPVIEYILHAMFDALKSGGVAFFQVPTYREAYEFKVDEYMENSCRGGMEMHLLPQKKIFEIACQSGCIPMEVYQDALSGQDDFSTTFIMKKL